MKKPFIWDEANRSSNLTKHAIDFLRATEVFENPHYVVSSNRNNEERWTAIGYAKHILIAVAYTLRMVEGQETIRIITARKARDNEKKQYYLLYG